jgi:glycosyltransferase involved in cell wall biosynthesis
MNNIYFISPDQNYPTGGIKTLYRHVDFLNQNGFRAFVVHRKKKFRCTWFENQTAVIYQRDFKPDATDFVVIPEVYGPRTAEIWRGPKKVILNQNCYHTFHTYSMEGLDRTTPYLDPEVLATLVVSEDSHRYLTYAFPGLKVVRIHISVDGELFHFRPLAEKKPQIAFMPWKHPEDATQVINLLKFRGQLDKFRILPIENKTEHEVAAILGESLLFLSFGYPEGCPAPPLEAMLSGCLVIGYHGIGGHEYFLPDLTWPIEINHIVDFAKTAEDVLQLWHTAPETLESRTAAARDLVLREYSREREKTEILDFWNTMLKENA